MAKIAALVLPARRAGELPVMLREMLDMLRIGGAPEAATWTAIGRESCVALAQIGPDPLNRVTQPVAVANGRTVLCGYVLPDARPAPNEPGVSRLGAAVAARADAALPALDGVFAFAHWDERRERLLAGVDKLGMRPLFWTEVPGGGYAIASEVKALVALLGDRVRVNWTAWQEQLALGYQIGDHTLVEDIERFAPAQVLECGATSRALRTTEQFVESIEESPFERDAFMDENHELFRSAMRRCDALRDPAERPLLTISGGLDSRRFLGWMLREGTPPELYTVPLARSDGMEVESGIVRHLARLLDLEVMQVAAPTGAALDQVRLVRDLGCDFETDEHAVYATTALALRRPAGVNVDGLAGDTLLNPAVFLHHDYLEAGGDERFLSSLAPDISWVRLPGSRPPLRERLAQVWAPLRGHRNRFTLWALNTRGRRELALGPMMLQANAFESVYPYLERDFVRQALRLPPRERIGTLLQRPLIAKLGVPALDETPSTRDAATRDDPRFRCHTPKTRLDADRRLLARVARRPRGADGVGLPFDSALRVQIAWAAWRIPGVALRNDRVQWQAGKAAQADRLLRHTAAVAGGAEAYRAMLTPLRDAWGRHGDWITPL